MEELKKLQNKSGLLIHHWDTDGICSAAVLYEFLSANNTQVVTSTLQIGNYRLTPEIYEKAENFEFIIIADIAVLKKDVLKLQQATRAEILLFDHHLQDHMPGVLNFNPTLSGENGDNFPAAAWFINDLLNNEINILPILGAVGDLGAKLKKNKVIYQEIFTFIDSIDINFSELLDMIELIDSNFKIQNKKEVENAVFTLLQFKDNPKRILTYGKWRNHLRLLEDELNRFNAQPPSYKENHILLFEINTKFDLISAVTRHLASQNKEKSVIVVNNGLFPDEVQLYIRRSNGLSNSRKLIMYARNKGYSAGGKRDVVGVVLPKDEKKAFLNEILTENRKWL
jgi:single-stranded DNA-specific DHH superfamily exonuclease